MRAVQETGSVIAVIATISATLCACFPGFDLTGKDRCQTDGDCTEGKRCLIDDLEGAEGQCALLSAGDDAGPDDGRCAQGDADGDGVSSLEGCPEIDCDDGDDRRSPLLPEFCDGIDNDCDDIVDEGALNVCGQCGPQPAEVCNGRDDDCDGTSDDGVTNACGSCGPVPTEFCDGVDNDCDGFIDEGLEPNCACEEGQVRVCPRDQDPSVVVCTQGSQFCEGGRWGPCMGASLASPELCDGADDDCDEAVDEGFALDRDASHCGACGNTCGTFQASSACVGGSCRVECRDGAVDLDRDPANGCEYACHPLDEVETCDDGLDNDCNGTIDGGCPRVAISGDYAFFNLFGRNSEGLPPGLVTGSMSFIDPRGPTARFEGLTLFASDLEGGQFTYNQGTERRVELTPRRGVTLHPGSGGDNLGGRFIGQMTPDRSAAAMIEFNGEDQQVASFALIVKKPDLLNPTSNLLLRGLLALGVALPGELLEQTPQVDAAMLAALSLKPLFPKGEGRHVGVLGAERAQPLNPFEYEVDRLGRVQMSPFGQDNALSGLVDDRGGFGVLLWTRGGQTLPGLSLLIERRRRDPALPAEGGWVLVGLQTALLEDNTQISYNAVLQEFRIQNSGAIFAEGGPQSGTQIGLAQVVTRAGERAVELDLRLADNLQPPRLLLRGFVAESGQLAVFQEIEEGDPSRASASIFLAISIDTQPSGNNP